MLQPKDHANFRTWRMDGEERGRVQILKDLYNFFQLRVILLDIYLWFILSYFFLCGIRTGLLCFVYNCFNIICQKKKTYSYHCFVLTPSSKINYHDLWSQCSGWVCVEYPQRPGFCLQHPKRRKTITHGCADSFLGPCFYLAVQLYVSSVLFLLIRLYSKFWKSEAGVLKLRSLSRFFQPVSSGF